MAKFPCDNTLKERRTRDFPCPADWHHGSDYSSWARREKNNQMKRNQGFTDKAGLRQSEKDGDRQVTIHSE